jgi:hypothetical protein
MTSADTFLQACCLSSFLTLSPREMYNYAGDNTEVAFQPLLLPLFRLNYSATLPFNITK